jgi:hypothetical protein
MRQVDFFFETLWTYPQTKRSWNLITQPTDFDAAKKFPCSHYLLSHGSITSKIS